MVTEMDCEPRSYLFPSPKKMATPIEIYEKARGWIRLFFTWNLQSPILQTSAFNPADLTISPRKESRLMLV
jgi:hypothetical protein